jgi:hypothetical protein
MIRSFAIKNVISFLYVSIRGKYSSRRVYSIMELVCKLNPWLLRLYLSRVLVFLLLSTPLFSFGLT